MYSIYSLYDSRKISPCKHIQFKTQQQELQVIRQTITDRDCVIELWSIWYMSTKIRRKGIFSEVYESGSILTLTRGAAKPNGKDPTAFKFERCDNVTDVESRWNEQLSHCQALTFSFENEVHQSLSLRPQVAIDESWRCVATNSYFYKYRQVLG